MKIKVFLANLCYSRIGTPYPLNIAYLASYVQSKLDNVLMQLFIEPDELLEAVRAEKPDLVAVSNYTWNRNLNYCTIQRIKEIHSDTLIVAGGPCFSTEDFDWKNCYFLENPGVDFYISNEGEKRFAAILAAFTQLGSSVKDKIEELPEGVFARNRGIVTEGTNKVGAFGISIENNLDSIPSPYLNRILDDFIADPDLIPIIETVRGCPYNCTFCCWGSQSRNRLDSFSLNRVISEIDYLSTRSKNQRLIITDGNFGILQRDSEIAEHIRKTHLQNGWPEQLYLYFDKKLSERTFKVASKIAHMTSMNISRQSLNKTVLQNIKRQNMDDEWYDEMKSMLANQQINSMVELIYPLPGETLNSFIEGLSQLSRTVNMQHTEIRMYPAELLPGSELASSTSRKKFGIQSSWRIMPDFNKNFKSFSSCEYQEIITSTNTFSFNDYLHLRKIHFFISLFCTYGMYYDLVQHYLLCNPNSTIVDFIVSINSRLSDAPAVLLEFFNSFDTAIQAELIPDDIFRKNQSLLHYHDKNPVKVNIYFILMLLYGKKYLIRDAFNLLLLDSITRCKSDTACRNNVAEIIEHSCTRLRDFVAMEETYVAGVLENSFENNETDKNIAECFIRFYDNDLISTINHVYNATYPGKLGKLLLCTR